MYYVCTVFLYIERSRKIIGQTHITGLKSFHSIFPLWTISDIASRLKNHLMRWGCAVISATVGLPAPLCGCHRPAGCYYLCHRRSQQVRLPFFYVVYFIFVPLSQPLFSFFFLLFYFQRFPRPSPAVRSPVMIGPELLKERPLANNRGLCSCVHVRPTRRWRRARGDAVKEIEKELKKGRQTLETGVHLHIMLRHRRDRISRDVLSPTDSSYCEKPPEKAKPILRRGLILFILLQTPRQLEIFPCFCTQARETIRTLVHKHDTIVTIKLKYRSCRIFLASIS